MSLASFLTSFVVAKVRKRGASYLSAGQVTLAEWSAERVVATVSGSEDYSVEIRREGQDLRASCTCPFFDDRDELCKHIWATLLAADREGALRGPRGGMPRGLYAEPAESSLPKRREPPRARAAPPPPAWHAVLDRLQVTGPPLPSLPTPARTEEILYVIDVPATVQKQRLTLNLLACRRKLDGSRGATHPLRITRGDIAKFPDPADREALALLAGATKGDPWNTWYYSQYEEIGEWKAVPDESAPLVARLLCATGRCHLRTGPQALAAAPLAWDDGPPWEVWLAVREEADGGCTVGAELRRGGERRDLEAGALLLRSGLLIAAGRVTRFERDLFGWTPLLRGEGGTGALRVPAAEREDLLTRLLAAPTLPHLELPEALRVEEVRATPRPRVRLHSPGGRADAREQPRAELSFLYDGGEVAAAAPRRGFYQREERRFLLRDPAAEARSGERLLALGFRPTAAPDGRPGLRVPQGRIPAAVRTLLAEGWSVEAEGKLYRSAGAFRLAVASGIDWLELHGEAEFEGATVALPALLAALRRGEGFVALGDGSLGVLPEEWLQRLAPLAGLGQPEGDHLQFRSSQAALLDAWLAGEPAATCDEAFAQARERLRGFAGIAAAAPPPGFQGELRPYQRAGLGWLGFLQDFRFGGCLADDMGLGKTVQLLALLESRRERRTAEGLPPSLLVVPRSLVFNWLAEAARFTPALRILDHTGVGRSVENVEGDSFAGWDVVLTTYGTLRRDVAVLRQIEFDYLILDEAQAIKNADSQTAKAARLLRGRHRLALTGTPVENHLGELWSLLEFLNPGILGASPLLAARSAELRDPGSATREVLARALRPFILRRTKEQVAAELPAKLEQTLYCELPPKQRRLYDELREHYRAALGARLGEQGLGRVKILVLEALLRLRQAACHPALLDRGRTAEPSAKLDLLLPQLREIAAEGHKVLVFSQFTSFLGLLREQLDAEGLPHLYLDGRTRDRREKVERFQSDPGFPLFLISLKAGGLGLNLTAADYVYLLDPWWNPAVEAQAIDRAHRIGQTRPVFAYRLVARDTVEEKILELQRSKRALADAIIQADQSLLARLSREDLELLLS